MKRIVALLLSLVMILACGMVTGNAEDDRPTITATVYDRGNIPESVGDLAHNPVVDWINEHSPVKVEFITAPRWTAAESYAAWFAAGTAPDLINEYECGTWINEGYAMPLDDLIVEYSVEYKELLEKYPAARKVATPGGRDQMYTFVRIWPSTSYHVLLVREDWLEKLNLEVPTTFDEFKEVLLAMVEQDPDGNGEDDTLGTNITDLYQSMMGLNDDIFNVHLDINGEFSFDTENLVVYEEFQKWMYDNYIIDHDFLTDGGEKAYADFVNGRMGVLCTSDVQAENQIRELYKNDENAKVVAMNFPETQFGKISGHLQGGIASTGFINSSCTHPQDVIKFIDFMQSDEFYARVMFGVEGVHFHFDENGVPVRTPEEQEKYSAEMQWASGFDYCMSYAKIKMPNAWADPEAKLTADSDRAAVDYAKAINQSTKWLFEDGRTVTLHIQSTINVPTDVQLAYDSMKAEFNGIWAKAITSGDEYGIDDALIDYQKLYEESGYQKYVDFMMDLLEEEGDSLYISVDNLELKPGYID